MSRHILFCALILLPAAAFASAAPSSWTAATLLGVDMAADVPVDVPSSLDLLSVYLDATVDGEARLRLSLVRATDPSGRRLTLPRDASFEFYWDLAPGGTALAGRADFAWDLLLEARAADLLEGRGRLGVAASEANMERIELPLEAMLRRDTVIWTLSAAALPASAAGLLDAGSARPKLIVRSVLNGAVIDELDAREERDFQAHCALMHHGNQSLTYTDVFHGRWDDEAGSGFDEALQVHEAAGIPGNFHLSGPLQTSAEWDYLSGDPQDFNGWLAAGAAAGWVGMVTSAYAQHMMPFVTDAMNDWAVNIQTDMTSTRYGYFPTVAWVPERLWLTPGNYPDASVIDAQADNWLDHGIQAVILDDDVHCIGYDGHQIHTIAGSSLKVIPRDNVFTGRLHAGDGAGALAVLTGLANSGDGDFRIALYADDWEMAAEIGEWANSMPNAKETYDWFVWKAFDESAWLSTWKLSDAVNNPNFAGVVNMNVTNGTYWSIGGTDGYGGANNAWYGHWAGFIPWVTGGDGSGGCGGVGGSCQNYGSMWTDTQAALSGSPTNAISEAGWYAMMTNLYETGWHDGLGGPISGWEHSHSAHIKNGRYYAAAAHWGNGEWSSPGVNAFASDVDGDGFDELILHNERLMLIVESAGGRIVHMSVRDGGLVDTAMGCDNVYWFGTEGDYNDGNHVAGLSEVSPDYSSQPFAFSIDSLSPDSLRVTLTNDSISKTLILRSGEPYVRCVYDAGAPQTYVKSGFSPSLVSLIWNPELERVWDPQAKYMGYRNPDTGLFAGLVVGDGGASHSAQFSGRLMMGDEVTGDYRFEFYLYAASAPAPIGGEIPALEALAASLVDVLQPAAKSAVYFPGTDRLRLELDDAVELAAVDPTRIAIDDDGDGVAELTLSGATSIDGFGWKARVDLILTPADAGVLESLDTGSLTLLLTGGAFADGSGLPNEPLGAGDAFPIFYGPPTLVTIDGNIDHTEWSYCELSVDDPNNDSEWSVLNELQQLYLSADESYLYLGLEGRFELFNGWVLHLDADYGQGTGESDLSHLPFWDKNAVFTYPGTGIDYLFGSWAGANGDFYSIDGPTAMTNLNAQGVILSTDIGAPWPGSEIAIPWDLLYGLGDDALPVGALLGISAAIAGGIELGGDVMPNNLAAALPVVDNLALIVLDADLDGVPDKPDHQSPVLLAAIADTESDTLVTLRFSEALDPATAENPVFYRVYETLVNERQLAVSSVTMASGDSAVVLVTEPQDPVSYTVAVQGLRDGSCYLNVINPNSAVEFDGSATPVAEGAAPVSFALLPNWPNPFNPATTVAFRLTQPGEVELDVYDIAGRRVARLASGEYVAGAHQVIWQGRDDRGRPVASGLYFAVLRAPEGKRVHKMLLLK